MFLEVWGAGTVRLWVWECVRSREADINTILSEFRKERGGEVALGHLIQIV